MEEKNENIRNQQIFERKARKNKQIKVTIQDLKTEIETIKKT